MINNIFLILNNPPGLQPKVGNIKNYVKKHSQIIQKKFLPKQDYKDFKQNLRDLYKIRRFKDKID